jgi:hypothetical protein
MRDIRRDYSEANVAAIIRERLTVIERRRQFSALRRGLQAPIVDLDTFLAEHHDLGPYVPSHHLRYQRLLSQIQTVVRNAVPEDATVAVVSRGDPALLRLPGRKGWHFPQTDEGLYAGHNPADGAEAIRHLEEVRRRGAQFLLFPATALWWLDHYEEFRRHLESRYRVVERQEGTGVIFALCGDDPWSANGAARVGHADELGTVGL